MAIEIFKCRSPFKAYVQNLILYQIANLQGKN